MRVSLVTIVALALWPISSFAQTAAPSAPSNSSIPRAAGQSAPPSTGEPVSGSRTMGVNPENERQDTPGEKKAPAGKDAK